MDALIRLLKRLVKPLLPWPVLRLVYRWDAYRYIRRIPPPENGARPAIVALNHFYDQDLRAMVLAQDRYGIVIVNAPRLFRGAHIFFDEDVRLLRAPYDSADPRRIAQYRDECRLFFERLYRRFEFRVLITSSDVFYWVREFITVARESGVTCVVLDKEGTISPYAYDAIAERIRTLAPFVSDHIYVWSESQREFWKTIGVAEQRITVAGQPRSDLFFSEHRHDVDAYFPKVQPLVSVFSLDDAAYLPREALDRGISWMRLKRQTLDVVDRLAEAYPNQNFLVKAHPQQRDLDELRARYSRDNLVVVGGAAIANELIQRSDLIIGFQTTALIEAMMLDRPVIYTAWDEDYRDCLMDALLPLHRARGIVVAHSLADFEAICRRVLSGDRSDFACSDAEVQERHAFVNRYFHQPDGHVCERIWADLVRFIA